MSLAPRTGPDPQQGLNNYKLNKTEGGENEWVREGGEEEGKEGGRREEGN